MTEWSALAGLKDKLRPGGPIYDRLQSAGLLQRALKLWHGGSRSANRWAREGCLSPAPPNVKIDIVKHFVRSSGYRTFVETGTYLAGTLDAISAMNCCACHSIEIAPFYYERAKRILKGRRNVHLILGDSGVELPKLAASLDHPAIFWLDGHYSGGLTGKGEENSPISAELDSILASPIKEHIILIDDAREFIGEGGYPQLSELLRTFDNHPHYMAEVSADIIRILPLPKAGPRIRG